MKALLVTPEIAPWVREGVTGDVAAGLARALQSAGAQVTVALPDYPVFAGQRALVRGRRRTLKFSFAGLTRHAVWTEARLDGQAVLLLEKPEYFDRAGLYGSRDTTYDDNFPRFLFFAAAALEMAKSRSFDVVHAFDWPGALVAALRAEGAPPVSLGLNDLVFQGLFPADQFPQTGLPWEDFGRFEFHGQMNVLKAGMLGAAAVVFPGERMSRAGQMPGTGCGLEGVAASVAPKLHGILSGADYDGWLDARTPEARRRKVSARRAWLSSMKLQPLEPDGMLVVLPLAWCGGRGLDLLLPVLDRLMDWPLRLVVLGRPELSFAPSLQLAALRHGGSFAVHTTDDVSVLRAAAGAADMVLVPEALEPADSRLACAMRAGAVPLAQFCPGLHEIVRDHDPAGEPGTGLVFYRHDPEALWDSFVRAFALRRGGMWDGLTARAAATDFSWDGAGPRYAALFRHLVSGHAA